MNVRCEIYFQRAFDKSVYQNYDRQFKKYTKQQTLICIQEGARKLT